MTLRDKEDPKADHLELLERVRHFVAEEVTPRAALIDR